MLLRNTIALLGFKHVGKSTIGQCLSTRLGAPFIDLDQRLESAYAEQFQAALTCRQILQNTSADFFHTLETTTLAAVLQLPPAILALGGATPLQSNNQMLLKTCTLIHVTAPRDHVFARLAQSGRPAFCRPEQTLRAAFNAQWRVRGKIYAALAALTIENDSSVAAAVDRIIECLLVKKLLS